MPRRPIARDRVWVLLFCLLVGLSFASLAITTTAGTNSTGDGGAATVTAVPTGVDGAAAIDGDRYVLATVDESPVANVQQERTRTPTATPAQTEDERDTATPAASPTATPTPTPTQTSTPPPTQRATATPTPTATPTGTPTTTANSTPAATRSEPSGGGDGGAAEPTSRPENRSDYRGPRDTAGTNDRSGDAGAANVTDEGPRNETATVLASYRQPMPSRSPREGTILLSFDEVPVSTISFHRNAPGNVTVSVLGRLPSTTAEPPGDRLTQFRIGVPGALRDSPAEIIFSVEVASLEASGIPNDAVWLTHYDDEADEWERIETAVAHETETEVVYRATTPGFSLFAVRGDSAQYRRSTPTEGPDGTDVQPADAIDADEEPAAAVAGGSRFAAGSVLLMGTLSVVITVLGARELSGSGPRKG